MSEQERGTERELKFATADLEDVRRRLRELGAEQKTAAMFEDNRIFDHRGELRARRELLRLRLDDHGARLTFKGVPRFDGGVKIREELEVEVSDAAEITLLLERLGYEPVRRYQKKREEWHLGACAVALDHTPIGDFVEFEGAEAASAARRCGFEPATAEVRSYLDLYDDHRRSHPSAPPDMLFS